MASTLGIVFMVVGVYTSCFGAWTLQVGVGRALFDGSAVRASGVDLYASSSDSGGVDFFIVVRRIHWVETLPYSGRPVT